MSSQKQETKNSMKKHFTFSLVCTLLISLSGFAQTDSLLTRKMDSVQSLGEILIQNERIQIPYSKQNRDIVIIDEAVIKTMPVKSVNELLSYIGGIDVRQRGAMGSQADIGINGGTFDQTLVLVNGMKISDPQTGHNMMNLPFNLGDIKRIEVLKGSAASAYGINAINGAINIITKQPKETGVSAHIYSGSSFKKDTTSNHLYNGLGVEASGSISTEKSNHFLSVGTIQSNGYRHNTDVDDKKIFYSNRVDLGKGSNLKMMGGYISNNYGANGFYAAPNDTEAYEKVETSIASAEANIHINDFWTLKPGLSYRYNSDDYILVKPHPEIYENKHYTNVFDGKLNNSFYTGIGTFGLGLEMRHEKISSNSLGHHSRNNIGFYGNYNLNLIPKTIINIGLYTNYNSDFGWDWMPSIDAGYQILEDFRIYANAGMGMRAPTYTDLYYSGPTNIGNPDLKPEKAWKTSIGLKYNTERLNVSGEYFYNNTNDFIDWVKDSVDQAWKTLNYQKIKMQGISLSADYRLIDDTQNNGQSLLAGLSYTYLNPEMEATVSDKISHYAIENLKHQLAGRVNFQFLHNFHFTLSGKYEERVSYKDYFLLATRVSADIHQFNIYLDADNITDVQYIESGAVPMPGRWFTLGVKWQWLK